jgi:riboflavin kinase/FMN adenylyltransferase
MMQTATGISELAGMGLHRVVAALGVFDGVHLGHRRVISQTVALAEKLGAEPIVVTFRPHPREVLFPDQAPALLSTDRQKVRLLGKLGVRAVVFLEFTPAFAHLGPAAFVQRYLAVADPAFVGLCVGSDWRFGHQGEGTVDLLDDLGRQHGFEVETAQELAEGRELISSTRIRAAVAAGNLALAAELLGRPYSVQGTISHGKGLGDKTFGCPTANVDEPRVLLPPNGVYAAVARLADDEGHLPGIVYVGRAPTMGTDAHPRPVVELHLFDYSGDLYGSTVEVEFHEFLRGDRVFADREELRAQIQRDVARARKILGRLS